MSDTAVITAHIEQPIPAAVAPRETLLQRGGYHLYCVAIGLDVFVSGLTGGGAYSTISARVGVRMADPTHPFAHWTWPLWWRRHCLGSVRQVWVS